MIGKEYSIAQFTLYTVIISLPRKEPIQAFRADVGFDGGRVQALTRVCDRPLVQVRGKDLQMGANGLPFRLFKAQNGKPVRFLAGGTAKRPDADLFALSVPIACTLPDDLRDDLLAERLPRFGIPEEV